MKLAFLVALIFVGGVLGCGDSSDPAIPGDPATPTDPPSPPDLPPDPTEGLTVLLDTGSGDSANAGGVSLFAAGNTSCSPLPRCAEDYQFLAGQFSIESPAEIRIAEVFMAVRSSGRLRLGFVQDDGGLPGEGDLGGDTFTLSSPSQTVGPIWHRFEGMEISLDPGTYWILLEPVAGSGFSGVVPGNAPRPIPREAYFSNGNDGWLAGLPIPGMGFRLFGELD